MNIYLKPIAQTIKELHDNGEYVYPHNYVATCINYAGFTVSVIIILVYNGHNLYACVCVSLGIAITLQDNSIIECHALPLCSTCDLPAKALVMNMIQLMVFMDAHIVCKKVSFLYHYYVFCMQITKTLNLISIYILLWLLCTVTEYNMHVCILLI